jgi:hypothetical protein
MGQEQSTTKKHVPQEMNHEQVRNLLKFVDSSQSEEVKESVFGQLGYECFHARNLDKWIGQYEGDVQASAGAVWHAAGPQGRGGDHGSVSVR